jgi:ribonucleoside-triphosphate reductase (thioredoxin)
MAIYRLSESFLAPYKNGEIKVPFGAVGAPTYYRTYSRPRVETQVNEGTWESEERIEHWWETCRRVIEGSINLGIANGDPTATNEWAEGAYDYLYRMGWLAPGRGLWMMGTKYQYERGGDALVNCWFIAVRPQSYQNIEMYPDWMFSHPEKPMVSFPFVFTFDRAMAGGGVGFSVEEKNISQIPRVLRKVDLKVYLRPDHPDWEYIKNHKEYEIIKDILTDDESDLAGYIKNHKTRDSRQGWGMSYRELIDAHFVEHLPEGNDLLSKYIRLQEGDAIKVAFDFSDIREYGALIRGFGGTSSGPLPLIVLFKCVNDIINARVGSFLTSVDCLDMMNLTGRCVVAGNVRRTALIGLGTPTDKKYVDAKNYTLVTPIMKKDENGWTIWENGKQVRRDYQEVVEEMGEEKANELFYMAWAQENHRWASNNSVVTDENFTDYGFLAAGIIANGEPGVGNIWLMKNFGRIIDGFQKEIDKDAEGLNPCAEITLANGECCNVVEFVPYMCLQQGLDIFKAIQYATEYAYRITFADYEWPVVREIVAKNRRIGVSLTGIQDYFLAKYDSYALVGWKEQDGVEEPVFHEGIVEELDSWYKHVVNVNENHAKLMNSIPSIKKTTVKPSGTVAKLPGVSSGIHWHYAPYLIQRIRFHELDQNLEILRRCGLHIEPAMREPNTMIVEFPVKAPNADHPKFKSAGDVSLKEQFANQYLFALMWADNAVSATLTFQQHETDQIEGLLRQYGNRIKSTSLLPYAGHGYVQAPWEPISKERYEEMVSKMTMTPQEAYAMVTQFNSLDILDSDCAGGACPIR